jgi:hypothetical protein
MSRGGLAGSAARPTQFHSASPACYDRLFKLQQKQDNSPQSGTRLNRKDINLQRAHNLFDSFFHLANFFNGQGFFFGQSNIFLAVHG